MSVLSYKCPSCGGPLAFSGEENKLACASCGNTFETDALEALTQAQAEGETNNVTFSMPEAGFDKADMGQLAAYSCQFCGAELVTDANTSATECAYCGSPAIMAHALESGQKPEKVIPFKVTQQQAKALFDDYFKGKRLLPNIFINTKNRVSEMRKLYVPYWLFSCDVNADITYNATKVDVTKRGDTEIRTTSHFLVRRAGQLAFDDIPVDGSAFMDDKITESLEPYTYSDAIPFSPAVLSGALADNADVEAEVCKDRAMQRVQKSTEQMFRDTVTNYNSVSVRGSTLNSRQGDAVPVLLPVWLITTDKTENGEKKTYTFAINGQTGKLTCDVPYARGKANAWFWGLAGGIFAAGYALLLVLKMLEVV